MRWRRYCRSGLWRPNGCCLNSRASSSRDGSSCMGSWVWGSARWGSGIAPLLRPRERGDAARQLALQQERIEAVGNHAEALGEVGPRPVLVRGHEAGGAAVLRARGDDLVDRREIGGVLELARDAHEVRQVEMSEPAHVDP